MIKKLFTNKNIDVWAITTNRVLNKKDVEIKFETEKDKQLLFNLTTSIFGVFNGSKFNIIENAFKLYLIADQEDAKHFIEHYGLLYDDVVWYYNINGIIANDTLLFNSFTMDFMDTLEKNQNTRRLDIDGDMFNDIMEEAISVVASGFKKHNDKLNNVKKKLDNNKQVK